MKTALLILLAVVGALAFVLIYLVLFLNITPPGRTNSIKEDSWKGGLCNADMLSGDNWRYYNCMVISNNEIARQQVKIVEELHQLNQTIRAK
jgi:hypothetical protein